MTPPFKPVVFIISAPSGSGKSTLVTELLKVAPSLDFSISYTTRAPRGSEQNGKQYYFVARDEFEAMIRADEFLEHACVFDKDYYGTARRFLREAEQTHHDLLLDIDVQGAAQIKEKLPDAASIFVLPPDRQILERRLLKRGEDKPEVIERRLEAAGREIENYNRYNYILINDNLDESTDRLEAIVQSERLHRDARPLSDEEKKTAALAETCRLEKMQPKVQPILDSFRRRSG